MSDTISLGDIGTDLQITITEAGAIIDVSSASLVQIELTKPDGSQVTKTAGKLNGGSDGIINYTTEDGDIDQLTTWSYRGIVTFSATQKFHSIDPKTFEVV
jgi:hypothetical protein